MFVVFGASNFRWFHHHFKILMIRSFENYILHFQTICHRREFCRFRKSG